MWNVVAMESLVFGQDSLSSKANVTHTAVCIVGHELNKDKTNILVVGMFQMRNIDLPSNLMLGQTDLNLSTKMRNLGVVVGENLTLKYQVAVVKNKPLGGIINLAKISNFIDRESELKLVQGLILT